MQEQRDQEVRRNSREKPKGNRSRQGNPELIRLIRAEIQRNGSISFRRFMELALYHPQHGYYASGRARIGRHGDFFTNVSVGPLFGNLLAAQFAEIWKQLGQPADFQIVEQGTHDGQFAGDVLSALATLPISYVAVEPFPALRERQQERLASFAGRISWVESVAALEPFTGIHFSNELFDSLPVHLLASDGDCWRELFVTIADQAFAFAERASSTGLRPPECKASALRNRRYERAINVAAPNLMRDIAAKLARGVILTIDYGFHREEFYSPERDAGTLQVRARHRKLASPFEQIGLADISAHVNWTDLIEAAQSAGAQLCGFADQHHFLTGIITECFAPADVERFSAAERRALQTLLHPELLGRSFQVLALGKNFFGQLSGFRFARNFA